MSTRQGRRHPTIAHTNAGVPGYRCSSTTILKVVNHEVQPDKLVGPLCR